MFKGQAHSTKRLDILYDDVERHYHVIANLTVATASKYVCKGCNKACTSDVTPACDQTCSDWMADVPCAISEGRIPYAECNRPFRSHTYCVNIKQSTKRKRSVCVRVVLCDVWMARDARKSRV